MFNYLSDPSSGSMGVVITGFVLAGVLGLVAGWALWKFIIIGFIILGGIAGFFAGALAYNLIFVTWWPSVWAYAGIAFGTAIVGCILASHFREDVIIVSTSLIGSYIFVRGISMFAGGYPDEVTMFKELGNDTY